MDEVRESWGKTPKAIKIILMVIGGLALAVLLGLVLGIVIQWLWNALMPGIFHLREITYWEAVGIFVLARFIFGCSFGSDSKESKSKHDKKHGKDKSLNEDGGDECRNWKYYDEWWESEGKKAFDDYINKKK